MTSKEYFKEYYLKNKQKKIAYQREYYKDNKEDCLKVSRKWAVKNKTKVRKASREWARKDREQNPEKYKEYSKTDIVKKARKKWYNKNKEYHREYAKKYFRRRVKEDIQYRLRWLLRGRISGAFRFNLSKKALKSMELIGCSIENAKAHIEKQFLDDMNWGNHGKVWEIDHIIPIASFDLTEKEEQIKAFNYKNLQPLYKFDNRSKGSRIVI